MQYGGITFSEYLFQSHRFKFLISYLKYDKYVDSNQDDKCNNNLNQQSIQIIFFL